MSGTMARGSSGNRGRKTGPIKPAPRPQDRDPESGGGGRRQDDQEDRKRGTSDVRPQSEKTGGREKPRPV